MGGFGRSGRRGLAPMRQARRRGAAERVTLAARPTIGFVLAHLRSVTFPLKPWERAGWTPPRLALDPLALLLHSSYPSWAALADGCGSADALQDNHCTALRSRVSLLPASASAQIYKAARSCGYVCPCSGSTALPQWRCQVPRPTSGARGPNPTSEHWHLSGQTRPHQPIGTACSFHQRAKFVGRH